MELIHFDDEKPWFKVLQTGRKSQVARMVLAPGKSSGPMGNEHPKSEQVLYVIRGEVLAEIGDAKQTLRQGDAIMVPPGAAHRFTNHSESPALTLNIYSPPAYDPED